MTHLTRSLVYVSPTGTRPVGGVHAPAATITQPAGAAEAEAHWPLGLTCAFVISSSILLWMPIIACVRWLLG